MRISSPFGCLRTIIPRPPRHHCPALLLDTDREPCGAPPVNAGLEPWMLLKHLNEALQLGPVREYVVRQDRAPGTHFGKDQLEIPRVVFFPGVNEHEIERALDRREKFQRVSAAQLDVGLEAQALEVG